MKRLLPLAALLAVLGAGAWYMTQPAGAEQTAAAPAVAEEVTQADTGDATQVVPPMAPDMAMGAADAPVTLVEYASFTCPHCGDFHGRVFDKLKAEYIDTGKVRFVHREVYFDRYGLWAAMVARCGGEMRYFGIVDRLYETQKDWVGAGQADEVLDNLRKIGKTAGMNDGELDACLNDQAMAEAMVAAYQTNAEADDITGTPTLIINGEKHPNMSWDDLKTLLDGMLES